SDGTKPLLPFTVSFFFPFMVYPQGHAFCTGPPEPVQLLFTSRDRIFASSRRTFEPMCGCLRFLIDLPHTLLETGIARAPPCSSTYSIPSSSVRLLLLPAPHLLDGC